MNANKADNTRRLAKNTLFLYARSFICLVLSLYTSRLILQALGEDNYGLKNVVGGFASMFPLITGSLSAAVSRFLTYEQGTGNKTRQKQIFSLALNMMIGFALIIFGLSQTFGTWYLENTMNIPAGREAAAMWTFRCAILTAMTGLIVSPFNSAIIAHEKMGIYAIINVVEAFVRLAFALYIAYGTYTFDKLILYTTLWTTCTVCIHLFAMLYSSIKFDECRFRLYFDKNLLKELFGYAGWSFLGTFSGTVSGQGVNQIINIFCGTAVNAARSLSYTVQHSIAMFVNNFTIALTPQITKAYATKDQDYVKYLVYRGSRFSFFIMFLVSLPVLLEAEFVFTLWLGKVPAHTINFNRIALFNTLLSLSYIIFGAVQNASGNIRKYKFLISIATLCEFPVSWIALKNGLPPECVYLAVTLYQMAGFTITHSIVMKTMPYTFSELFKEIYLPELKVVICSAVVPTIVVFLLPYGWVRFLITGTLCVLFTVPSVLYLGCRKSERELILSTARKYAYRFIGKEV